MPPTAPRRDRAVALHVTVVGLPDVQRVLTVLTGRGYPVTRFAAGAGAAGEGAVGCWGLTIDLVLDGEGVELVRSRLERLPGVLAVDVHDGELPPPAG